jgi:hypothetical protein
MLWFTGTQAQAFSLGWKNVWNARMRAYADKTDIPFDWTIYLIA